MSIISFLFFFLSQQSLSEKQGYTLDTPSPLQDRRPETDTHTHTLNILIFACFDCERKLEFLYTNKEHKESTQKTWLPDLELVPF